VTQINPSVHPSKRGAGEHVLPRQFDSSSSKRHIAKFIFIRSYLSDVFSVCHLIIINCPHFYIAAYIHVIVNNIIHTLRHYCKARKIAIIRHLDWVAQLVLYFLPKYDFFLFYITLLQISCLYFINFECFPF